MRSPEHLGALLGVELADIGGLSAGERGSSFRSSEDSLAPIAAAEQALRAALGELGPDDAYWMREANACDWFWGDVRTGMAFLDVLPRVATFVTNARWDTVVYTEALPQFLAQGYAVEVRSEPAGALRPGVIELDGAIRIRFPTTKPATR